VEGNAAHYILSVMRAKEGDAVLLFNGRDGEWAARASQIRKRDLVLECVEQTKALETSRFLVVRRTDQEGQDRPCGGKGDRAGRGADRPVLTPLCGGQAERGALTAQMIEAAEQCAAPPLSWPK
jgi:16S rRNA (uracil1498-N3)-methyltransferase